MAARIIDGVGVRQVTAMLLHGVVVIDVDTVDREIGIFLYDQVKVRRVLDCDTLHQNIGDVHQRDHIVVGRGAGGPSINDAAASDFDVMQCAGGCNQRRGGCIVANDRTRVEMQIDVAAECELIAHVSPGRDDNRASASIRRRRDRVGNVASVRGGVAGRGGNRKRVGRDGRQSWVGEGCHHRQQ